jgi:hypothetical protein
MKIAMLSKKERREGIERLRKIANRAAFQVTKWIKNGEIRIPSAQHLLPFTIQVCRSCDLRDGTTGRLISAVALPDKNEIGLVDHMMLAPTEVILSLTVHEYLHLVYPMTIPDSLEIATVRPDLLESYADELHAEEEWVRRMTERICGSDDLIDAWDIAVECGGNDWRRAYDQVKKSIAIQRSSITQVPTSR